MKNNQRDGFLANVQNDILDFFTKLTSVDPSYDTWKACVYKYTFNTIVLLFTSIVLINIISNPGSSHYNIQKYFFLYVTTLMNDISKPNPFGALQKIQNQ